MKMTNVKTIELSNELLETLKTIENCASCKDKKIDGIDLDTIKNYLAELEKEEQGKKDEHIIDELNNELFRINIRLNKEILCECCKGKRIKKLTDKCGNKEVARVLHECRLNPKHHNNYIRWIPIIHGMVINLVTRNYVINFIFNISNYVITYYVLRITFLAK